MTLTRSQLGETPKRTEYPGFVETPTRRSGRPRKGGDSSADASPSTSQILEPKSSKGPAANGGPTPAKRGRPAKSKSLASDVTEASLEFGGTPGVIAVSVGYPLIMYFMWIGATYYDGKLPWPRKNESWADFGKMLTLFVYTGAFPTVKAWIIYWGFCVFEGLCYLYLPGVYTKGKQLEWEGGKRLDYYCSGVWSWYTTVVVALTLHATRLFRLDTLIDEFGPIMSVAILSGTLTSIAAYVSAHARGKTHRMTGHAFYDFFTGAEINPRLFKWLDLKMFFEVRLPWYLLFLISLGTAARQWEKYGYVSGEVAFLVFAHFLYANACAKGEELITTSWDIYHEKWGFMLIFWNMAGVPFSYCHCAIYLANHHPDTYRWPRTLLAGLYVVYILAYWVWDSCNSQKNRFRQQERGTLLLRRTFPQVPWQTIENPQTIKTKTGDSIMVDGWYKYVRKAHYTADIFFALAWGLITGFNSPFPYFYAAFFVPMILHRAVRDQQKCRRQYGAAWEEYERRVPWVLMPYIY